MKSKIYTCFLSLVYIVFITGNSSDYVNALSSDNHVFNCEELNQKLFTQKKELLEWYIPFVKSSLGELPDTEIANMIQASWLSIINNPDHILIKIFLLLSENGFSVQNTKKLTHNLIGFGIDVTNSCLITNEISDLLTRDFSLILFDEDLSSYREVVRNYSANNYFDTVHDCNLSFLDLNPDMSLLTIRDIYHKLIDSQKSFINSNNNYNFISNEMSTKTNHFIKSFFKIIINKIHEELKIPADSEYFLYFREFKTFASDADVLYVGPNPEEVNKKLVQLLPLFGLHMDIGTSYQINERIENKNIDGDVFLFFFKGEIIESKGGLFNKFYKEKITENLNKQKLWQILHPYLCKQLLTWTGRIPSSDDRLDFKKLQYRAVMVLISGLSFKFNVDGYEINDDFMERLGTHLDENEIEVIENALAFSNQARNLYQLTSETRWRPRLLTHELEFITKKLTTQGIENFDDYFMNLGEKLEAIRLKYFGDNVFTETTYVPREQKDQSGKDARNKRAQLLKQIIHENTTSPISAK